MVQEDDVLIYENPLEPEGSFSVHIPQDNKFLVITTKRSTEETSLKHYIELDKLKDRDISNKFHFYPIIDEWKGSFTFLHNIDHKFYFVTNFNAPYKKIIAFDIRYP